MWTITVTFTRNLVKGESGYSTGEETYTWTMEPDYVTHAEGKHQAKTSFSLTNGDEGAEATTWEAQVDLDDYELMYGPFTTEDGGATWKTDDCGLYYLDEDGNKVAVTLYEGEYDSTTQTWTWEAVTGFTFTETCASTDLVNGKALIGTITCPVCGQEINVYATPEHYIDKTDTSNVTVVEATCEHGGYVVGECAICGETEVTMWTGNSTAHDFIEYVLEVDEEKNVYVVTGLCSYCGGWEYVSEGDIYNDNKEVDHTTDPGLITDNEAELTVGVYAEGDYDPETKTLAETAEDCWDSSANDNAGAYTLPTHLNAGWRVYTYTAEITVGDATTTYYAYDKTFRNEPARHALSRASVVISGFAGDGVG